MIYHRPQIRRATANLGPARPSCTDVLVAGDTGASGIIQADRDDWDTITS